MASFSGGDLRRSSRKRIFDESSSSDDDDFTLDHSDGSEESAEEFESSSDSDLSDDEVLALARDWTKVDTTNPPRAPPRFPFIATPGVTADLDGDDPLDAVGYLELLLSADVMTRIVTETNRYADQHLATAPISRGSRVKAWKPVTEAEMKVFFALLFLQGIVDKPVVDWYWSKRRVIETPVFGEVMSKSRFILLMKFLHFANNEDTAGEAGQARHKLRKIWPVLSLLRDHFKARYMPEEHISVDESLMLYKGRLSWKQFLPLKRSRFGVKFYVLCESATGYIWDVIIYTGKGTDIGDEASAMGTKVVMRLMEPLLDKGYCLTVDNFYTSPELVEKLLSRKTDVYGTVRPSRKDMPPLRDANLKKGDIVAYQRGKCMALQWRDKKLVTLLSTVHDATMTEVVNRKKEKVSKPAVVIDYNHTMGGVDKSDQMLSYYPATRSRQKIYYKNIFRHLLDMAVFNAFVLHQKQGGKLSHLEFRLAVVEGLIQKYHDPNRILKRGRPSDTSLQRLTARHFVSYIPPTPGKELPTRRCVVCCKARGGVDKKVRKETRYWCKDCGVGLCAIPCFEVYHTKAQF